MDRSSEPLPVIPVLGAWVRGTLVGMALGLVVVFAVAAWLNPYDRDGEPLRMETHRQIGLPPCTFKTLTGLPCPSCGMTTSFALLVRGDVVHSLRANWVGTLLALAGLAFLPWSLACVVRQRSLFIVSMDKALLWFLAVFLVLLLGRWTIVLAMASLGGTGP